MDSDTYELREATWEEFHQNTIDNFVEWGHPLNIDAYWQREVDSKDVVSNHRPWCFLYNGVTVASCETYGENSAYCYVENDEYKLLRGRSESVASVFVAIKYRNKGYATKMMRMLRERCHKEGAIFVDLYSDIDPIVYEKCGWHKQPDTSIIIDTTDNSYSTSLTESERSSVQMLEVKPSVYGAFVDQSVILWSQDLRDLELNILCLAAETKEKFKLLVDLAYEEAQRFNLKKVKIWWSESSVLTKEYVEYINQPLQSRNGSVPMVVSFINPDHTTGGVTTSDTTNQSQMVNIEKFTWV
ncbi:hypothetical protein PPL_12407 [Heterostelium album PN500]|uniref:N-acetyltransferase domain-containing protein n=1 Tax=Heterostelium pallidum (strain ATCC 26659 / Pp 5 / PN500) TaxID=670386 RepID=D3BMI7_HETP5|nr:hypothetical protein PPL_12407 [Heterostelium album PN500]EFA77199.1 hypothetical protein PPL_12407 [Heterostelium album PN500]|eukprot:XP_020429328.1 hypothetical protein PPL_12407 [Heterostelium album PN500]